MTKTITEHTRVCQRKARIVCEEHFISLNLKGALEMRHSVLYFFSLVRISEYLYVIFRPLAHDVRISSKASATAVKSVKTVGLRHQPSTRPTPPPVRNSVPGTATAWAADNWD